MITGLTLSTPALLSNLGNIYLHVVTQGISLLLFPTLVFIVVTIIQAAGSGEIDPFIVVGFMVMGVMPTTVASNLAMTRTAKGNVEAATAEVCIGAYCLLPWVFLARDYPALTLCSLGIPQSPYRGRG